MVVKGGVSKRPGSSWRVWVSKRHCFLERNESGVDKPWEKNRGLNGRRCEKGRLKRDIVVRGGGIGWD